MAAAVEKAIARSTQSRKRAREQGFRAAALADDRPPSPKGWTGPKVVDGLKIEGTFRAHQVPLLVDAAHPDHVKLLESWMKSYRAEELFDANGTLRAELAELAPKGARRIRANRTPTAEFSRDLKCPTFATMQSPSPRQAPAHARHDGARQIPSRRDAPQRGKRNFRSRSGQTLSNLLGESSRSPVVSGSPRS